MPDSLPPQPLDVTTGPLPGSRKIHVPGTLHPCVRVAMREIALGGGEPPDQPPLGAPGEMLVGCDHASLA